MKDLLHLRHEFVHLAAQPDVRVRALCARFGVSPTTGYKWLARHAAGGAAALADRPRRPRSSPARTPAGLEAAVVALRRQHPAWGARKLHRRLADQGVSGLPSPSTLTAILHRHGLIAPAASQAAGPFTRFERPAPNPLWQVDFQGHFALRQGRCHPLGVLDDHSRYNLLLAACADQRAATVQAWLTVTFRRYGLPDALLWDHGSPWGSSGGDEPTALEIWLLRLGVRTVHGRPRHPQTQGQEERFHRTLEAEVLALGGWTDCPHVQAAFDRWRPVYNTQRPHEALGLATPVSRYRPSPRPYPEVLPELAYAPGVAVRRVDAAGRISYRGGSWKAGRALVGQPVGLRPGPGDGQLELLCGPHVLKVLDRRTGAATRPD